MNAEFVTLSRTTGAPEQTEVLGEAVAGLLPHGAVVALEGDFAAGKTCLVRGIARGYACAAPVHSPTFALVHAYHGTRTVYHLDLYRLGSAEELGELGLEELFEPDGVTLVEWAERAAGWLPPDTLRVHLAHAGGDTRSVRLTLPALLAPEWDRKLPR